MNHQRILLLCLLFSVCFPALASAQDDLQDTLKPPVKYRVYRSFGEGLQFPDSVFVLDLSRQKRKEIPEQVRNFVNLRELILSKNNIRELPDWIGEMRSLRRLDVSNNNLTALPATIGKLDSLVYLLLNRNRIEALPAEIGDMSSLEEIELWDNELSIVPDEIRNLRRLKMLELRGILFSPDEQDRIRKLLPETDVLFSPPCNCKD